jgi:hypothetical protein
MEVDLAIRLAEDISNIKERINSLSQVELAKHSEVFEEIHTLLQQALSNLDGI